MNPEHSVRLASSIGKLVGVGSVSELATELCSAGQKLLDAAGATFVLSEGEEVYYAEEVAEGRLWKGQRFPVTACISGWAIKNRTPAVVENVFEDSRVPQEAYVPTFVKSLVMMPLQRDGKVLGALGIYWNCHHKADEEELLVLNKLASAAARALAQADLFDDCARLRGAEQQPSRPEDGVLAKMVPVIAHDLRTPLSVLITGLELLKGESLSARGQDVIRRMKSSANRANRMVRELLDYSEIREHGQLSLNLGQVDLTAICKEAIQELRSQDPEREIRLHAEGEFLGYWDRDRLIQCISNLIRNALEHGDPAQEVRITLAEGESTARLSVHNEGAPIPEEVRPHLFQAFCSAGARRSGKGKGSVGLGLFIADQIVQGHGGSILLESGADGTTFTVVLPRHPARQAHERSQDPLD